MYSLLNNSIIEKEFEELRKNILECGCTCIAVKKMVYESYLKNGDKKLYMSGIHVINDLDLCKKYLRRFKNQNNKIIVQCVAYNTQPKPDGREGVLLADEICLIKEIEYAKI